MGLSNRFWVIMRRECSDYINGAKTTPSIKSADRYYAKTLALGNAGPNTCVCGPYLESDYA